MGLISYKRGQASIILRVKILDSTVLSGAGKTGLAYNSAGLIISTIADNEASATAYTQASSNIETITTLGTYAAPTTSKCRFREVDSTNHKGIYEIQLANARYAVSSAKSLAISISGASGAAETDVVIPLTDADPYDAVRQGMTALPNAAAEAVGGLYTRGSGVGQINQSAAGQVDVNVESWNTTAVPAEHTAGYPIVTLKVGTGTGEVQLSSGVLRANDSSGNAVAPALTALSTAQWTNTRAGYLDKLNISGVAASQADINALNQSASRRATMAHVPQFERPESGSVTFTVEVRTYDGDGAAVNADSTPTLSATGSVEGDLGSSINAPSNPATGVYRWGFEVDEDNDVQQVRFDISATISASTFTLSTYAQITDYIALTWTTVDRDRLADLYSDWVDGGRLDLILDGILDDTGTSGVKLAAAQPHVTFDELTVIDSIHADLDGSVIGQVGSVLGSVGSVVGNVEGNVTGTVNSVVSAVTVTGDFSATMKTSAQAAATAALNAYDPPTNAELEARTLVANQYATASVQSTIATNVSTLLGRISSTLFAGITSLLEILGLIAGKQTGNTTARNELRGTGAGGGSFNETTDSLEALRDNLGSGGSGDVSTVLQEIKSQTDLITANNVTVINAYASGSITIKRGDSYSETSGQTISIPKPSGASWPDLSDGWTLTFTANKASNNENSGTGTVTKTCVVVSSSTFRIDLTTNDTDLAIGSWDFDVQATKGSDKNTLILGAMTVIEDETV